MERHSNKSALLKIAFIITSIIICSSWTNRKYQSDSFTSSKYLLKFVSDSKYGNETRELNSFHFDFKNREITLKSNNHLSSFYIDSLRTGFLSNENNEIIYKNSTSSQFVYCHKLYFNKEARKDEKRRYIIIATKAQNNIVTLEIADLKDGFMFLYLK